VAKQQQNIDELVRVALVAFAIDEGYALRMARQARHILSERERRAAKGGQRG